MSARSRRKGAAFERRVAGMFREAGIEADRVLTECRDGNIGDVALDPRVPVTIQAKVGASPAPWQAFAEAEEASGPGVIPVAVLHRDGRGSRAAVEVAVLPLASLVWMLATITGADLWGEVLG